MIGYEYGESKAIRWSCRILRAGLVQRNENETTERNGSFSQMEKKQNEPKRNRNGNETNQIFKVFRYFTENTEM